MFFFNYKKIIKKFVASQARGCACVATKRTKNKKKIKKKIKFKIQNLNYKNQKILDCLMDWRLRNRHNKKLKKKKKIKK